MKKLLVDFKKLTRGNSVEMFINDFDCGIMLADSLNGMIGGSGEGYESICFSCMKGQRITASFFEGFFSKINYRKDNIKEYIMSVDGADIGLVNEKEMINGLKRNFYKNIEGG